MFINVNVFVIVTRNIQACDKSHFLRNQGVRVPSHTIPGKALHSYSLLKCLNNIVLANMNKVELASMNKVECTVHVAGQHEQGWVYM